MDELTKIIRKQALINATKHGGQAQPGAVIGMIMGSHPEYRKKAGEVSKLAAQIVGKINQLSPDAQKEQLDGLGGFVEEKKPEDVYKRQTLHPGTGGKQHKTGKEVRSHQPPPSPQCWGKNANIPGYNPGICAHHPQYPPNSARRTAHQ